MTGNATFFNARRRVRQRVAPFTRLPALRACKNPSVGTGLAQDRSPSGECRFIVDTSTLCGESLENHCNSLLAKTNSLLCRINFPVTLCREFVQKHLNSMVFYQQTFAKEAHF
jgi:hypothetical protein